MIESSLPPEGGPDVWPLLFALIENPSRDTYLSVWQAVTQAPDFNPYSSEVGQVEKMFDAGQWQEAMQQAYAIMPSNLLRPRLHWILSLAAEPLGNAETHQLEGIIAAACIAGILATGDGSADRPYLVTCTGDEYDVLLHLQKEIAAQALLQHNGATLDRLTCTDGAEIHFDITAAFAHAARQSLAPDMPAQPPAEAP